MYRNRKTSGFTLVEILIVVIILGILAAIVIPQFTNASQDARKNSLTSELQTVRSQLELAKLQHLDQPSPDLVAGSANPWDQLTVKTDGDSNYTIDASGTFGPYLNSAPANPLNGGTLVIANTGTTEPAYGDATGASSTNYGWVYYVPTGKIFATSKDASTIYNEVTGAGADVSTGSASSGG
jgi:general secretion pathway protein G